MKSIPAVLSAPQLCLLAVLAAHAGNALAQSSYAGSYAGTETVTSSQSCTIPGAGTTSISCTGVAPWTGIVDSQGNFTLTTGTLTETCGGFTSTAPGPAPEPIGLVGSNGTVGVAASTSTTTDSSGTVTVTCTDSSFHFTLLPPGASSTYSCTSTDTIAAGGTCNFSANIAYSATRSAGTTTTPVFPITVNSNINTTSASATAQIQPPAQSVGTTASVYVFAHVRQSALTHTTSKHAVAAQTLQDKDGPAPDPCVLAQLNANGTLTSASASTLQPYTTGVLNSQAQAVTILNNVPTPNVAGASFYVGYGSTSGTMLSSGVYEGAVSVPGTSGCSAALLTGAAPESPSALSGLWWNSNESGWGISFTQRRNIVFGAWYTYDSSGKPTWYVVPNCPLPSGDTGTSGSCTGDLYSVSGPTFFGTAFNPALDNPAKVGSLTMNFQDANTASMSYTVGAQSRTVPITRQSFQTGSTAPAVDYTDLWWNPNESGWGAVITQQYGVMFLAWYVYDSAGKPVWYVAPDCVVVGSGCIGSLYSTTGPPLGPTFNPSAVVVNAAGSVTLTFVDANNAMLSYTVNGSSNSKAITRQTF